MVKNNYEFRKNFEAQFEALIRGSFMENFETY